MFVPHLVSKGIQRFSGGVLGHTAKQKDPGKGIQSRRKIDIYKTQSTPKITGTNISHKEQDNLKQEEALL